MKKNVLIAVGLIGLLVGVMLNAEYALSDYGMRSSWFAKFLLAETTDTPETPTTSLSEYEKSCRDKEGGWNVILKSVDHGTVGRVECSIAGEISVFGFKISGSYQRKEKYDAFWDHRACEASTANCCFTNQQGLYINNSFATNAQ
ncbi:hypothetical protein [Parabacteroides sp. AM08-6]|uniref:hypothetical protein n=1 Tax=Parabacteroides sp. AM08-6 TaxID=2292053 RepID=UPI000EFE824B|nr:hypothetical protein [Parabacteroides sp. AM08-6]RHJ85326.1 hypothetical protein DW103_03755 [Parabacteroides sp. AM08-6]